MKLHVFNPEHDIALARNDKYFTAPRAGRQLRNDCGFMPALWADDGDYVLVNDVNEAKLKLESKLEFLDSERQKVAKNVSFVTLDDVGRLPESVQVEPWGWDSAISWQLKRAGLASESLPSQSQLETIREISNRRFSSPILRELRAKLDTFGLKTVGESEYVTNLNDLESVVNAHKGSVLKEPWSSSGRGVRYVKTTLDEPTANWARNIITRQGGIMIEPDYNKLVDFGMEFTSDGEGVRYRGLSVFSTNNGFYLGNLIADESQKVRAISEFISEEDLESVHSALENILSSELKNKYKGPLGVDMMIVDDGKDGCPSLHPMVEINMRRTMGHVAIDLLGRLKTTCSYFRINYVNNNYSLEFTSRQ